MRADAYWTPEMRALSAACKARADHFTHGHGGVVDHPRCTTCDDLFDQHHDAWALALKNRKPGAVREAVTR